MKRVDKILAALHLQELAGFFVMIGSPNESVSVETNLLTAAAGAFVVVAARAARYYVRELGRPSFEKESGK